MQDLSESCKSLQQDFAGGLWSGTLRRVLDPDPAIVGPRVRAARAYAKAQRIPFAKAVGTSPSNLDLLEGKRAVGRGTTWGELARVAAAAGLPFEFFTADFDRLHEIRLPGAPIAPAEERRATPPPGELGRRLGVDQPTSASPPQRDSDQGKDAAGGAGR